MAALGAVSLNPKPYTLNHGKTLTVELCSVVLQRRELEISVSDVPPFVAISCKDLAVLGLYQGPSLVETPLSSLQCGQCRVSSTPHFLLFADDGAKGM